jgi:hypothetical protein
MRLHHFIILLIATPLITSCATIAVKTRIADYVVTPKENPDNLLSVVVNPYTGREDGFCFTLTNTGNETVSIDWDNSYLVINNRTFRCIHDGIRFMEKAAPQATTPVAPGTNISDCLFPESNIELNDIYEGWIQEPLNADSGEYSIAINLSGKQENIQGSFTMIVKDYYVPSNNMSSSMSYLNALYVVSCLTIVICGLVLFL